MRWKHAPYKPGDWEAWWSWHPVILVDTGTICWLENVWRKQIPYQSQELGMNIDGYISRPKPRQWWLYCKDKSKAPTFSEGYYEVI